MKTKPFVLFAVLAFVGAGTVLALDPVKGPSRVAVVFFEPEKFTDVKDAYIWARTRGVMPRWSC
jgi:hypothetical protein